MNANDFISGFDYVDIKEKSDNAEPFEFEKIVKVNGNRYTISISGRWHTSWKQGCDDEIYHTFINFEYRGSEIGYGGSGGWFEFKDFEDLKQQINKKLEVFHDYTMSGQLCLF